MITPQFKHDCDKCVHTGSDPTHDYYYCSTCVGGPTVIARYSNEGPDYASGMCFGREALRVSRWEDPMAVAYVLAMKYLHSRQT